VSSAAEWSNGIMGVQKAVAAISSIEFYSVSLCGLDCVYLRRMMDMMGYKQIAATAIA